MSLYAFALGIRLAPAAGSLPPSGVARPGVVAVIGVGIALAGIGVLLLIGRDRR
ncbi:hypothetical protein GCM10010123_18790 [Pilimelia anulata]|uniref:Uncharacterized protein n=1 Tax=Pilimelia anulata TaxID=53371 RepID=A0A8J3B903_9ACTN|nr:hypothetical protein [Pilimelia anulata]GGJ89364.1 hypothetical protein GCM10010123_18790 [Pilimelia anulata]